MNEVTDEKPAIVKKAKKVKMKIEINGVVGDKLDYVPRPIFIFHDILEERYIKASAQAIDLKLKGYCAVIGIASIANVHVSKVLEILGDKWTNKGGVASADSSMVLKELGYGVHKYSLEDIEKIHTTAHYLRKHNLKSDNYLTPKEIAEKVEIGKGTHNSSCHPDAYNFYHLISSDRRLTPDKVENSYKKILPSGVYLIHIRKHMGLMTQNRCLRRIGC